MECAEREKPMAKFFYLLLLCASCACADLYKWSEGGSIHYGDTPPDDRRVERVRVDDCATVECEQERERRREETRAAYRELEAWLARRAAERAARQTAAPTVPIVVPGSFTYVVPVPLVEVGRFGVHPKSPVHRRAGHHRHHRSPAAPPARHRVPTGEILQPR